MPYKVVPRDLAPSERPPYVGFDYANNTQLFAPLKMLRA